MNTFTHNPGDSILSLIDTLDRYAEAGIDLIGDHRLRQRLLANRWQPDRAFDRRQRREARLRRPPLRSPPSIG